MHFIYADWQEPEESGETVRKIVCINAESLERITPIVGDSNGTIQLCLECLSGVHVIGWYSNIEHAAYAIRDLLQQLCQGIVDYAHLLDDKDVEALIKGRVLEV